MLRQTRRVAAASQEQRDPKQKLTENDEPKTLFQKIGPPMSLAFTDNELAFRLPKYLF